MKKCKRKKSYPDWANYKVTNRYSKVFLYENKPHIVFIACMIETEGRIQYLKTLHKRKPGWDWTRSLRKIKD